MIIQSSLWLFGFWAQGPDTPTNLGPVARTRLGGRFGGAHGRERYGSDVRDLPSGGMEVADLTNPDEAADIQSVQSAATTFLAEQANEELGQPRDLAAIASTQFAVVPPRSPWATTGPSWPW